MPTGLQRPGERRAAAVPPMLLCAALAPAAAAAASTIPTIFYLEHGHEHLPAAEAHASLKEAKVETVAAVPPSRMHSFLAGFPPNHAIPAAEASLHGGFRELARLVSHLEVLRHASARLPPDAIPELPEAIGIVMDRPSFAFERYWGTAGFKLTDWISSAPLDWQILQLSLVPDHGEWGMVDALPLEVSPAVAWRRWAGIAGLHCYVFKASFARYITRSFYRKYAGLRARTLHSQSRACPSYARLSCGGQRQVARAGPLARRSGPRRPGPARAARHRGLSLLARRRLQRASWRKPSSTLPCDDSAPPARTM